MMPGFRRATVSQPLLPGEKAADFQRTAPLGKSNSARRHANDSEREPVHSNRGAKGFPIAREKLLPEAITNHYKLIAAGDVLLRDRKLFPVQAGYPASRKNSRRPVRHGPRIGAAYHAKIHIGLFIKRNVRADRRFAGANREIAGGYREAEEAFAKTAKILDCPDPGMAASVAAER